VEKERNKIEVTIPVKGNIIRSEQISDDMYVSIDLVEEVIERQLRKYKNKLIAKHKGYNSAASHGSNFRKEFFESADDELTLPDDAVRIVRTKRFGVKPMFPEDACIQMDLLGHSFYVFSNAETDEVNVVYRRKDGSFGLIEPEFI
jgi:putative sigma-54 modulation protein